MTCQNCIDHSFTILHNTKTRSQSRKNSLIGYQIECRIDSTYRCIESADNVKTDTIPEIIKKVFTSCTNLNRISIRHVWNVSNMHYLFSIQILMMIVMRWDIYRR